MLIKLGANTYRIRFVASDTIANGSALGSCDHPDVEKEFPEILISEDLTGQQLLDTLIHESMHAVSIGVLDEQFVSSTATTIAKLLWKLHWRPNADPPPDKTRSRKSRKADRNQGRRRAAGDPAEHSQHLEASDRSRIAPEPDQDSKPTTTDRSY